MLSYPISEFWETCMGAVNMTTGKDKIRRTEEHNSYTVLSATDAALSLMSDYYRIFYVDMDAESFVDYDVLRNGTELSERSKGDYFFEKMRESSFFQIFEADQELIQTVFHKGRMAAAINDLGSFILDFRVIKEHTSSWVCLKAVHAICDRNHIVIGISDIDYQMNLMNNFERLDRERDIITRMAALSGKYICINTVDPDTNFYTEYRALKVDYEGMGLPRRGDDFFHDLQENCHKMVYSEDLPLFRSAFHKKKMMAEIQKSGMFVLDYRLVFDGEPRYVSMRAIMSEENGTQLLIIGLSDIDSQVKQNQEYAYHLSVAQNQATKDALTGVKNKYAFSDTMEQLDRQIAESNAEPFAVLVFDVNDLKQVNDTQGHQAGDEFLKKACLVICQIFKHSPVFRIGGDEFAVIARGDDYDHIDELMQLVSERNTGNQKTEDPVIACGMARYEGGLCAGEVFECADKRMYENKKALKAEKGKQR